MSTATATAAPRLKQKYDDEVRHALKDQLGLGNVMQVPKLEKIVINMGVGRATQQPSLLEGAVNDLTKISGQKPIVTKATKSVAAFKLREGQSIGCKVTLRRVLKSSVAPRISKRAPRTCGIRWKPSTPAKPRRSRRRKSSSKPTSVSSFPSRRSTPTAGCSSSTSFKKATSA